METDELYLFRHDTAVKIAQLRSRRLGVRHRVQGVTWSPPADWRGARWHVAATPAPAPAGAIGSEPCS